MKKLLLKRGLFIASFLTIALSSNAQTYTFTNCGVIGMYGPTQGDVNTEYSTTNLNGMVTINTQGVQEWTVPVSATYRIEARGAQGGYALTNQQNAYGGSGAIMAGDVFLTAGQTIYIVVGHQGNSSNVEVPGNGSDEGAGGGGSFVATGTSLATSTPLVVAGGGAGGTTYYDSWGFNASTSNDGVSGNTGGVGGTAGMGGDNGSAGGPYFSSGGGGFYGNGQDGQGGFGGTAFINGAIGGIGGNGNLGYANSGDPIHGGFGCGGSARGNTHCGGGGGGGYSGGGAGGSDAPMRQGGGGGSYMDPAATNVSTSDGLYNGSGNLNGAITNLSNWNTGFGLVVITVQCSPLNATVSATEICDGEQVTLSATGNGTITWDNGVQNGVAFDPPVGTTTYTATSSDVNDCPYSVDITVNPTPNATMTALTDGCFYDNAYSLTGGAPAGGVYSGNGVINDDVFDPGTAGIGTHTISYTITDPATGCEGVASQDVIIGECLDIEELGSEELVLSPNPTKDGSFSIEFEGEVKSVEVHDMSGRVVEVDFDVNKKSVNGVNLENGNYLVRIITDKGTAVRELVVIQ
jgi:hypothetical protein